MGFAVVVDSTLDMSAEEYQALDITMVPLNILVGEDEFKDQVEISSEEFYKRMSEAAELPKTAQPAPFDFVQTYERLAQEGYEASSLFILQGCFPARLNRLARQLGR